MSGASIWSPGSNNIPVANPQAQLVQQEFTATAGQTLFTLTAFTYTVGFNALNVYVNGVKYPKSEVTETSESSFTLSTPCEDGDKVEAVGNTEAVPSGNGITVQGSLYIDENYTGTYPVASGVNSLAISKSAVAPGDESVAIGISSNAEGQRSLSLGESSDAIGYGTVAIGSGALARSTDPEQAAIAIGGARSNGDKTIAIGYNAEVGESDPHRISSIAIGKAHVYADYAIGITTGAVDADPLNRTANTISYDYSVVIGNAEATETKEVVLADGFGNKKIVCDSLNRTKPQSALVEKVGAVAALDIDTSLGNFFQKTISAPSTFTFSNAVAGASFTLEITNSGGARDITWPASVVWTTDGEPAATTGVDVYVFLYNGTVWRGNSGGSYTS